MKLFIILSVNPFVEASASANRWLTLIEGLAKLGAEIQLLIYGGYRSIAEKEEWGKSDQKQNLQYHYINQDQNKGYVRIRYNHYIGSYFSLKNMQNKLFRILVGQKGIVWTDSGMFALRMAVGLREKQLNDLKLFIEMSEFLDIYKYNKVNILERRKGYKRQKFFEEKALYAYEGMALMTKTLIEHYKKKSNQGPKLLHLPMTVDLNRFDLHKEYTLPVNLKKPYIAFVGVMNDLKDGVNILIDAFGKIAEEIQDVNLYLYGFWQYDSPGHQKQIEKMNLQGRIFYMGTVNRDDIPNIIMNAELLVLPRPDSKQAQGGFPTKLGEYLATGKPVCCTSVGEIPDYLVDGESVYFAEPGSVDSFANVMRRALINPEIAKQTGLNGRKVAEKHFNMKIQAKILYNFLKSLY